jgi:hypothetical protein
MIRRCLAVAALILTATVAASPASAQRSKSRSRGSLPIVWSAGTGLSVPTGDLGEAAGTGFHMQGAGLYRRARWPIALRGELAYHRFGTQDFSAPGSNPNQTVDYTGKASSIVGLVDAQYSIAQRNRMSKRKPYVLGGLGFYNNRTELTESGGTTTSSSSTKVGLNLGGGMNFPLRRRMAFLEARYHHVDKASWIPVTFGVRF